MAYKVRMGVPEMREYYNDLIRRFRSGDLSTEERRLLKRFVKTIDLLEENPWYPSLRTHKIEQLSDEAGSPFSVDGRSAI